MTPTFEFSKTAPATERLSPQRPARTKANGPATAAVLIQIATELLQASPTMRRKVGISLTDLAAAEKVRKHLLKSPATY